IHYGYLMTIGGALARYTIFSISCRAIVFVILLPPTPRSTLFPYTTLFRSHEGLEGAAQLLHGAKDAVLGRAGTQAQRPADFFNGDRKSTRLNSSHVAISYAVFCLKKKNKHKTVPNKNILHVHGAILITRGP